MSTWRKTGRTMIATLIAINLASTLSQGGVVSSGTAAPAASLASRKPKIGLIYKPNRPDGQRLCVVIDGREVQFDKKLFDHELKTIASFVNSGGSSVVSLTDPYDRNAPPEDRKIPMDHADWSEELKPVRLHEAYVNTLVGYLMIFSDRMFSDLEQAGDLPMDRDRRPIRGPGVLVPEPGKVRKAIKGLQTIFGENRVKAWTLISDRDVTVLFDVVDGKLTLDGNPRFTFWAEGVDVRRASELRKLGETVSARTDLVRGANPVAYDALVAVMRWSAFFRYCKQSDEAAWAEFIDQIRNVRPMPQVETPQAMINQEERAWMEAHRDAARARHDLNRLLKDDTVAKDPWASKAISLAAVAIRWSPDSRELVDYGRAIRAESKPREELATRLRQVSKDSNPTSDQEACLEVVVQLARERSPGIVRAVLNGDYGSFNEVSILAIMVFGIWGAIFLAFAVHWSWRALRRWSWGALRRE